MHLPDINDAYYVVVGSLESTVISWQAHSYEPLIFLLLEWEWSGEVVECLYPVADRSYYKNIYYIYIT